MLRRQHNYSMAGVWGVGGVILLCLALTAIAVPRTETELVTVTQSIPYKTEYVEDDTLGYGETAVVTAGALGVRELTYEVTTRGRTEVSRELKSDTVTKEPVTEVVAEGTKMVWRCYDTTSFDRNPYNDNYCEYSDGTGQYVPDSRARQLDPEYVPGLAGAPYYNSF